MWKTVLFTCMLAYLPYIAWVWARSRAPTPKATRIRDTPEAEYDYVVVGAGSAGCVLAARLSQDPGRTVLLLEAGGDDAAFPELHVPINAYGTWGDPRWDWAYKTEPQQQACLSMKDKRCGWPRGKVLGGSGSLNTMIYIRGSRHDYDRWEAMGAKGWSYEDVLPYFKRAETNRSPAMLASGYHGDSGPVFVSDVNATILGERFVRAGEELGYQGGDVNGETQEGKFMHMQSTIKDGARWSVASSYLRPAQHRPNLHITTRAHVSKVAFAGKRAVGVIFRLDEEIVTVRARKEVILSAGAVGSAQLLLLSGVGPRQHLEELGIPVVADLPVGQAVEDHMMVFAPEYTLSQPVSLTQAGLDSTWTDLQYKLFRSGLHATAGLDGNAFLRVPHQPDRDPAAHLQVMMVAYLEGLSNATLDTWTRNLNGRPREFHHMSGGVEGLAGLTFLPVLLHPRSTGTIRLRTKFAKDSPLIDPKYLSHGDDVATLVHGIRVAQKLAATEAFRSLGIRLLERVHPACTEPDFDSDEYWECFVRQMATSIFHPTGSCRMGAEGDPEAVVHPSLTVQGLQDLRVVDASVMPSAISGNTEAATIMIAEKAADLITWAK